MDITTLSIATVYREKDILALQAPSRYCAKSGHELLTGASTLRFNISP